MGRRTYPDLPRLYIDMDGTVADFEKAMRARNIPASLAKMVPGLYADLDPIPGAVEAINELTRWGLLDLMICTKAPDKNPYSICEKMFWIDRHLPVMHGRVIVTPDKGCMGYNRDFIIDDFPHWANAHSFRGTRVLFGDESNGEAGTFDVAVKNWQEALDYFRP